jgi:hypothetical protein
VSEFWAELDEVLEGYYDKTQLPRGGDTIMVCRQFYPVGSGIVVRIRLDGYEIEFIHESDFRVPPHECWQRQGTREIWRREEAEP